MQKRISLEGFGEQMLSLQKYRDMNAEDNRKQLEQIGRLLHPAMESELNDIQRDMVVKYYFEGLTMQEISDIYGFNRSTVSRYLARSRRRLQRALKFTFLC